jgi:hypothetical protein
VHLRASKSIIGDGNWRVAASVSNSGRVILGWQNQDSKPHRRYAVGGGVANKLPLQVDRLIQTTLTQYAHDYP